MGRGNFWRMVAGIVAACLACSAASAEDRRLKVGALVYLTGPASFLGEELRAGLELCSDRHKVELIVEDSQYNPAFAVSAYNNLVDVKKVDMVISAGSAVSSALAPLAKKRGVPLLITLVSSSKVAASGGDATVRYFVPAEDEAAALAKYVRTRLSLHKAAVVYVAEEYGEAFKDAFVQYFEDGGGKIVRAESFAPAENDFRPYLLRLQQAHPDFLYYVGLSTQALTFLRQYRALGAPFVLGSNTIFASPEIYQGNTTLLEGALFSGPAYNASQSEQSTAFRRKFSDRYQREASCWAAVGCDVGMLVSRYGSRSPQEFRQALSRGAIENVMGRLSYDGQSTIAFPVCVNTVKDGAVVFCADGGEH